MGPLIQSTSYLDTFSCLYVGKNPVRTYFVQYGLPLVRFCFLTTCHDTCFHLSAGRVTFQLVTVPMVRSPCLCLKFFKWQTEAGCAFSCLSMGLARSPKWWQSFCSRCVRHLLGFRGLASSSHYLPDCRWPQNRLLISNSHPTSSAARNHPSAECSPVKQKRQLCA